MRIVYVIPFFAPAWGYGGPPRLAFDLGRQLVQRGHSVHVVTTDALDDARRARPRYETLEGITIERVPNLSNWLAWKYKILLPAGFGRALGRALRGAQVVHLFELRDFQNAVAIGLLQGAGIPFVLSALGELPRATGLKRRAKVVFDLCWGRRLIGDASALLAQTDDEATAYTRFGRRPERVRLLPLAVDVDRIERAGAPGSFRVSLGIAPAEKLVLFLGRLHEYKGLDVLIRAFARVRTVRSDVRLVIAGRDDGYLSSAQRLAAALTPPESVLFPGPLYGAARFDAYGDADLFALTPSHAEQTSLAALEACASGTAALITEQAPIPGLDAAGAGITVAYDESGVAASLGRLLDGNLVDMGQRAAALVRERHSLAAVAAILEQTYAEFALQPPSGRPNHA